MAVHVPLTQSATEMNANFQLQPQAQLILIPISTAVDFLGS